MQNWYFKLQVLIYFFSYNISVTKKNLTYKFNLFIFGAIHIIQQALLIYDIIVIPILHLVSQLTFRNKCKKVQNESKQEIRPQTREVI